MTSKLNQILDTLVAPVRGGNPQQAGRRGNGQRKKKNQRNPAGGQRGMQARNRGSRALGSRDNMLSLTRDQFTATSPLNLFSVGPGSTPGGIRVRGRELIGAVTIPITTGGFTPSTNFPGGAAFGIGALSLINPINFPRLSAYTPIYEYYKFHKVSYLFQSNQPTTVAGEVIMSIDYDPSDGAPGSVQAQMRNVSSTMANIYSDCSLQFLTSLSRLPRYETTAALAAGENQQQNQGSLCVAVEGYVAAAATTVGYIVAQYDVEFFTPQ